MKKIICTILTAVMLFSISVPVFASDVNTNLVTANTSVQPRASLTIRTNIPRATASSYYSTVTLIASGTADVTITLEKKSGSSWDYVDSESWSSSSVKSKTVAKTYYLTEPGTYRCSYSISATVGSNSDYRSGSTAGYIKK